MATEKLSSRSLDTITGPLRSRLADRVGWEGEEKSRGVHRSDG